ncbi:unnamed protein product [Schistosoma curassoni]|uniref:Uncharacterized protein n=1 Tax=Schistosoma curassoni TaxID=6186 RepID=A0A183JN62_9TREM|nr:unnamed protein product [Schistosoma curassoni]
MSAVFAHKLNIVSIWNYRQILSLLALMVKWIVFD